MLNFTWILSLIFLLSLYVLDECINVIVISVFAPYHNNITPYAALPELCLWGNSNKTQDWTIYGVGKKA